MSVKSPLNLTRRGNRGYRVFAVGAAFLSTIAAGCKDKPTTPAPSDAAVVGPQESKSDSPSQTIAPGGAGAADDPGAPECLLAAAKADGWTKAGPIRVFASTQVDRVVTRTEARRFSRFRVQSAATGQYESVPSGGAGRQRASVLVVETDSPEDAYGILTCQSGSRERLRVGGETRVDRHGGLHLHCWQGRSYVRVDVSAADPETTEQAIRLLLVITERIARSDRPAMLAAIPSDVSADQGLWLVRHLAALPSPVMDFPRAPDVQNVSRLLGLNETTLLCVARCASAEMRGPNVVWVVHYPTNKAAYDAHARYSRYLIEHDDPSAASTNLLPPHGPFLAGTWTAEEESLQYLLPRISRLLPTTAG